MSNYTLAVNWSGKDGLSDSDAAKVISGADFNSEFTTVRTAINSKADLNADGFELVNFIFLKIHGITCAQPHSSLIKSSNCHESVRLLCSLWD